MNYIEMLNNSKSLINKEKIKDLLEDLYAINTNILPNSVRELISINPDEIVFILEKYDKDFKYTTVPTTLLKNDVEYVKKLIGAASVQEMNQKIASKDIDYIENIKRIILDNITIEEDERKYYYLDSASLFPDIEELADNEANYRITINSQGTSHLYLLSIIFKKLVDEKIPFNIRARVINEDNNYGFTDSLELNINEKVFNRTCDIVREVLEENKDMVSIPNKYLGLNIDDLFSITAVERGATSYYSPMEAIFVAVEMGMDEYYWKFYKEKGRDYYILAPTEDMLDRIYYLELFRNLAKDKNANINNTNDDYGELVNTILNSIKDLNYNLDNVYSLNKPDVVESKLPVIEEVTNEEESILSPVIPIDTEKEIIESQEKNENVTTDNTNSINSINDSFAQSFPDDPNMTGDIFFELLNKSEDTSDDYIEPITDYRAFDDDDKVRKNDLPEISESPFDDETQKALKSIASDEKVTPVIPTEEDEIPVEPVVEEQLDNTPQDLSATQLIDGLVTKINESISAMESEENTEVNAVEEIPVVEEHKSKKPIMPGEDVDPKTLLMDDEEKVFNGGSNYGITNGNTGEIKIDSLNLSKDESQNLADSLNKNESEILGSYAPILPYEEAIKPICVSQSGTTSSLIDYLNQQDVLNKIKLDATITDTEGNQQSGAEFVKNVVIPLFEQNTPEHIFTIDDIIDDRTIPTEEQPEKKKGFFARLFRK